MKSRRAASENIREDLESCSDEDELSIPTRGYQLRAFKDSASIVEAAPTIPPPYTSPNSLDTNAASSLSCELVNETLNYFLNCRQRLNQMTKTYDDTDAYILLLQEKEVDLELAARIGQDLLRQNKQLRKYIENIERELSMRQEEILQLRHELSSKSVLLDTFIEEEEDQEDQQDKITELQEQLNEANRRNGDILAQNVSLQKQISDLEESRNITSAKQLILTRDHQNKISELQEQLSEAKCRYNDILAQNVSLQEQISELYELLSKSTLLDTFIEEEKSQQDQQNKITQLQEQLSEANCRYNDIIAQNLSLQEQISELYELASKSTPLDTYYELDDDYDDDDDGHENQQEYEEDLRDEILSPNVSLQDQISEYYEARYTMNEQPANSTHPRTHWLPQSTKSLLKALGLDDWFPLLCILAESAFRSMVCPSLCGFLV